ncbi:DNA-binding transcriptional LysR family regulator [Bradyrhizobium sp. cir1]|nr:DNA-binding transcriptional LysR family regulator [Bradyrhizobium sp. cir1]
MQAFVLTADLKSFTRAAEAMDTTQSAISLKIKRLEDELGRGLLDRTPRLVRLSADGDAFLAPARTLLAAHHGALGSFGLERRRLVVGISHHIVGAELPVLLRRMKSAEPGLVLEIRVSTSRQVLDEFDRGAIDAAIVLRHDNRRRGGEVILKETFGWMASADFEHHDGEPLRIATQADPCSVRSMAVDALNKAGIAWTEVSSAAVSPPSARQSPPVLPLRRSGVALLLPTRSMSAPNWACRRSRRGTWCCTRAPETSQPNIR